MSVKPILAVNDRLSAGINNTPLTISGYPGRMGANPANASIILHMPVSAAHQNLSTLCLIRLIPFGGQLLSAGYLYQFTDIELPWMALALLLLLFAAVIVTTWWRSHRPSPISDREFFAHLLVDVVIFSLLLYTVGGATNPFVSYYLVPVIIAAITLPRALTLLTGLLCLAAYTGLLFWHVQVPDLAPIQAEGHTMHPADTLNIHIIGMWLNFAVSAVLIIWFVTRMAETVQAREQTLIQQKAAEKERQLEDEQLLAVATLAASATHDLGTPLNTVRLIADDWRRVATTAVNREYQEDMKTIASQVERCQETLKNLTQTARNLSTQQWIQTTARPYFTELVDRWLLMRPDVVAHCDIDNGVDDEPVRFHPSLSASIHNILNNAADASPGSVAISIRWDSRQAVIEIRDQGAGIDLQRLASRGGMQVSEKPDGLGLGLFLSRAILSRHGGEMDIQPQPLGGTLATIRLPLWNSDD